ncbi:hypothetical protein AMTR_s00052p00091700 [Amborella trichopoda]|uniref:Uncharacterized protein n=1 Tax=Amborella trichopoda TaxID=13333 RepID=U5CSZ2_AMBTC|nr:hypothetical protein AMTR_s00052p00091700 [Amborella trichopoda]
MDHCAADSIDDGYEYASPSTYQPNSNPTTILSPPPPYYYASPSTYHPNSNPTTTLSPPPPYSCASLSTYYPTTILSPRPHHPCANNLIVMIGRERADNFLRAKEALNASIKREGGAFDIETSK